MELLCVILVVFGFVAGMTVLFCWIDRHDMRWTITHGCSVRVIQGFWLEHMGTVLEERREDIRVEYRVRLNGVAEDQWIARPCLKRVTPLRRPWMP